MNVMGVTICGSPQEGSQPNMPELSGQRCFSHLDMSKPDTHQPDVRGVPGTPFSTHTGL